MFDYRPTLSSSKQPRILMYSTGPGFWIHCVACGKKTGANPVIDCSACGLDVHTECTQGFWGDAPLGRAYHILCRACVETD